MGEEMDRAMWRRKICSHTGNGMLYDGKSQGKTGSGRLKITKHPWILQVCRAPMPLWRLASLFEIMDTSVHIYHNVK